MHACRSEVDGWCSSSLCEVEHARSCFVLEMLFLPDVRRRINSSRIRVMQAVGQCGSDHCGICDWRRRRRGRHAAGLGAAGRAARQRGRKGGTGCYIHGRADSHRAHGIGLSMASVTSLCPSSGGCRAVRQLHWRIHQFRRHGCGTGPGARAPARRRDGGGQHRHGPVPGGRLLLARGRASAARSRRQLGRRRRLDQQSSAARRPACCSAACSTGAERHSRCGGGGCGQLAVGRNGVASSGCGLLGGVASRKGSRLCGRRPGTHGGRGHSHRSSGVSDGSKARQRRRTEHISLRRCAQHLLDGVAGCAAS